MIVRRLFSTLRPGFSLSPTIKQLLDLRSETERIVTVSGWIKSVRRQKNVAFAAITDGSDAKGIQAVILRGTDDEILRRLNMGAAVRITGRLVSSPSAGQSYEIVVDQKAEGDIVVLGNCDTETYPIQKKDHSAEFLRDQVQFRARTSHIASMLRLRDVLRRRIDTWFESQGFCAVNTPIITGNDAEGAGEAFRLALLDNHHPSADSKAEPTPPSEFFGRPAFLTVSHQLHLEALATALSRVYTLSPCFRAELSQTSKHLAEFWMLEAEWAFPSSNTVHSVCDLTEGLLKFAVHDVLESHDVNVLWEKGEDSRRATLLDAFQGSRAWERMTYTEAIRELGKTASVSFKYQPKWGHALQSEHEKWLAESLVGGPVFVTDYPAVLKPFYMRVNDDEKTVDCFDLLVPHVGELVGGSVREERADILKERMGGIEGAQWYLDIRKYGGAPHVGFGMGFERLVSWVSGIENIRECTAMPRWAGRMLL